MAVVLFMSIHELKVRVAGSYKKALNLLDWIAIIIRKRNNPVPD